MNDVDNTGPLRLRFTLSEQDAAALKSIDRTRVSEDAARVLDGIEDSVQSQISHEAVSAAMVRTETLLRQKREARPALIKVPLYGECIGGECADHCQYTGRRGLYAYAQRMPEEWCPPVKDGEEDRPRGGNRPFIGFPYGDAGYGYILFADGTYGEGRLFIQSTANFTIT